MKYFVFFLVILVTTACLADDANTIATKQYVDGGIQYVSDSTDEKITDAVKDFVNKDDQLLNTIPVGEPEGDAPEGRIAIWFD